MTAALADTRTSVGKAEDTWVIEVEAVAKTYRRGTTAVRALRGVSFCAEPGRFTFVVGPSGCGKTTLLALIGALDTPTSGRIVVAGRPLDQLTRSERDAYRRCDVGFVFQNFNLLSNLTALENVLVPFYPVGVSAARGREAEELLQRIGLGERMHHRPAELSGGEQQRVAVVRAVLKRPKLILADEPTGELDSENGAALFDLLRSLASEYGTTVIVVTHDQSYLQSGDRVLMLRDGQIVDDRIAR